jgi:Na+/H+ antiporter NhaD/arsenite permease-like protein
MLALVIFIATYVVLTLGRFPGLRVDRTGAAIIGAALMVGAGVLRFDAALAAIDWATLILLLGMMIVVANLRLAGFFSFVAARVVEHAGGPRRLLAGVVAVSGVLSALFVNDTICLVLTPLVLEVTLHLKRKPLPYLLAVAMAANCGSVATITGNPQNMLVGSLSGIPYRTFAAALAPVAAVSLLLTWVVIVLLHRDEFSGPGFPVREHPRTRVNRALLGKSLLVAGGMLIALLAGAPVAQTAIVAGALLLITRRVKPEKVYHHIDWGLLAMFGGLFVVVKGVEHSALEVQLLSFAKASGLDHVAVMTVFSAALSNIVSNVPAVLVFKPLMTHLADPARGWLALAMSSTLAGNLTLVGSVANLIVAQRARPDVEIGFWDYFKAGLPLTLLSLTFGAVWLTYWK